MLFVRVHYIETCSPTMIRSLVTVCVFLAISLNLVIVNHANPLTKLEGLSIDEHVQQRYVLTIKSLIATTSILEFLDLVKSKLNIDSLIGVRIFADQADQILRHGYNGSPTVDSSDNGSDDQRQRPLAYSLVNALIDLNQQSEDVLRNSLPLVRNNDPKYFKGIVIVRIIHFLRHLIIHRSFQHFKT